MYLILYIITNLTMYRMNSKNTISITEARKRIFDIADKVQAAKTVFFLTQNGKAKVVMMSVDEFDSWAETLDIMSDPELMKEIREAEDDIKNKRWHKFTTWEKMEKSLGWDKLGNPNRKNVPRENKKFGQKRVKKGK